jgi:peroxiredoxin
MLQVGDPAPEATLQPVFGLPVDLHRGTRVVVFLRPLTGSLARATIQRLIEAYPRFDAEGIQVIGVTRTDLEFARDFVPRYHVLFPIYVDESGSLTDAWKVAYDRAFLGTLKSLRPATVQAVVDAMQLGRVASALPSSLLPAYFVVRDGKVVYARYASSVAEAPDVEALWNAASA